jgi:hypothetical protein
MAAEVGPVVMLLGSCQDIYIYMYIYMCIYMYMYEYIDHRHQYIYIYIHIDAYICIIYAYNDIGIMKFILSVHPFDCPCNLLTPGIVQVGRV